MPQVKLPVMGINNARKVHDLVTQSIDPIILPLYGIY
jgi:hypothetical protein